MKPNLNLATKQKNTFDPIATFLSMLKMILVNVFLGSLPGQYKQLSDYK